MDREKARQAIEDAHADGIKHMFGVLVQGITAGGQGAVAAFKNGVELHDRARTAALSVVDSFPDR